MDGQSGVMASIGDCGSSGPGSNPGFGLDENRGDEKWVVEEFIKIGIPSKGWLKEGTIDLLAKCGFNLGNNGRK